MLKNFWKIILRISFKQNLKKKKKPRTIRNVKILLVLQIAFNQNFSNPLYVRWIYKDFHIFEGKSDHSCLRKLKKIYISKTIIFETEMRKNFSILFLILTNFWKKASFFIHVFISKCELRVDSEVCIFRSFRHTVRINIKWQINLPVNI